MRVVHFHSKRCLGDDRCRSSGNLDVRSGEDDSAAPAVGNYGIFARIRKSRTWNARTVDSFGFSMPVEGA